MESLLGHFKFAQFCFLLRALDHLSLPAYKGSTFRGGFGYAFKKVVCVNKAGVCQSCLLKEKCVYSYVFETPPPTDTSKLRKYPFSPHPFILTPPLEEKRLYRLGETFGFELTLIGRSIDYLPYFVYTLEELGKMGIGKSRGKYQLEQVEALKPDRDRKGGAEKQIIYSCKDRILRSCSCDITLRNLTGAHLSTTGVIQLNFLTPTRLKFGEKLADIPEFHVLIRNLLRRLSLLSYFHCGQELNLDYKGLIERSMKVTVQRQDLAWYDWERYSTRQETKMKMGGFRGSITYEGDLGEFIPFLALGEYVHVGKGTSFGLGKYEIVKS